MTEIQKTNGKGGKKAPQAIEELEEKLEGQRRMVFWHSLPVPTDVDFLKAFSSGKGVTIMAIQMVWRQRLSTYDDSSRRMPGS